MEGVVGGRLFVSSFVAQLVRIIARRRKSVFVLCMVSVFDESFGEGGGRGCCGDEIDAGGEVGEVDLGLRAVAGLAFDDGALGGVDDDLT